MPTAVSLDENAAGRHPDAASGDPGQKTLLEQAWTPDPQKP